MTTKEYALKQAENIRKHPTSSTMVNIANDILKYHASEADEILVLLDEEVGNLYPIMEAYENKEQLSYVAQIRNMIAQAQGGKK